MALNPIGIADDFFVNLNLQTTLQLPDSRETILHFCDAVQKQFAEMATFYQRDSGEFVLESDRESGNYQWLEIHSNRLCAGAFNPATMQEACDLHRWLLDRSVYFLGIGNLDVNAIDVVLGFNLDYRGNRDAVVAEALLASSPLMLLTAEQGARAVECEPNIVVSLDEECYLQARLAIETRGSSYQVRTGRYEDEPISVYFTVRQYPAAAKVLDFKDSFDRQCELAEEMAERMIVPQVVNPIVAVIAAS